MCRNMQVFYIGPGPKALGLTFGVGTVLFIIVVTGWINWNNEEAIKGGRENFDIKPGMGHFLKPSIL